MSLKKNAVTALLVTFVSLSSASAINAAVNPRRAVSIAMDPVGGPTSVVGVAAPYTTTAYTIVLRAGEATLFTLTGSGSSDLDLFLYDANGVLLDFDILPSDSASVVVWPEWTGTFVIRVVNRGDMHNSFFLRAS